MNGVAVVSSTEAWAAGSYTNTGGIGQTLIERWDGAQWNVVPSPNVGATGSNSLEAISASSGNVWAVGYYSDTVTTHSYQTLIERWNGTQWDVVPSPNPSATENYLYGVAVVSASDVWAVGYYNNGTFLRTMTMRWNGANWNTVSSPNPFLSLAAGLRGVTVISANDVWAVGGYVGLTAILQTMTMHWNGSSWSIVTSPNTGSGNTGLVSVSGTASNNVWAVGLYYDGTRYLSLSEHWNGSSWSIVSTPTFGTGENGLGGVVATSQNEAWAVGGYDSGTMTQTLALHWNGTQWEQTPSENPGTAQNALIGIAASGGNMWAVGGRSDGGAASTLVEQYADVPCLTPTPTDTPVPASELVGHVTWQGRPAQPNALQQVPITLTLKMDVTEVNYAVQNTDSSGFFTVSVAGLTSGTYNWRVKNPKYLANSGQIALAGDPTTQVEMGLMRAADANNDNLVNATDFNVMKVTFGKGIGDPNYDARADFNGDNVVNATDFNLLKVNFGQGGAPPVRVEGP